MPFWQHSYYWRHWKLSFCPAHSHCSLKAAQWPFCFLVCYGVLLRIVMVSTSGLLWCPPQDCYGVSLRNSNIVPLDESTTLTLHPTTTWTGVLVYKQSGCGWMSISHINPLWPSLVLYDIGNIVQHWFWHQLIQGCITHTVAWRWPGDLFVCWFVMVSSSGLLWCLPQELQPCFPGWVNHPHLTSHNMDWSPGLQIELVWRDISSSCTLTHWPLGDFNKILEK